jgi:flagellar motility protein MotE (MotC chaperone)
MKIALLIVLVCAVSALALARHLRPASPRRPARNHEYREYWEHRRGEKEKQRKELARLDARIRRLEWRLAERTGRERAGEELHEDAAEKALAESLESMRSDRERLVQAFHERGRLR